MITAQAQTTHEEIQAELTGGPEKIPQSPGDVILLFSILAAVTLLIFLIAYFCHRASKQPRRKRRERRPRRPTLAETGGLPPPRGGSGSTTD